MKIRLIAILLAATFVALISFAAPDVAIPPTTIAATPTVAPSPAVVSPDMTNTGMTSIENDLTNLKLFGHDVFRVNVNSGAAAGNTVPIDYILGVGDTVSILVRGNDNTEYERTSATITPEGFVSLKLVGNVPLANLSLDNARAMLTSQYAKYYRAGQFAVTLEVVQRGTLAVNVVGEVVTPGQYNLPNLSTVFAALAVAGGPTDLGCIRQIRLSRVNEADKVIDAYDFLLQGKRVDLTLKNGDTIFIPMISEKAKLIAVGGEVRRPAKYELLNEETLGRALEIAGGVTPDSSGNARLKRVDKQTKNVTIVDLQIADNQGYILFDGDQITVRRVLTQINDAVSIKGAVNRPGSYSIKQADTVTKLLTMAGGPTADAYVEQAMITSLDIKTGERRQTAIDLRSILAGTEKDVKLVIGDVLQVYKRSELPTSLMDVVWAKGAFLQPGSYLFKPGMKVSDLVQLAFGTVSGAYLRQVQLSRYPAPNTAAIDGTVLRPSVIVIDLEKALAGDKTQNLELQVRDELQVYNSSELPPNLLDQVAIEGAVVRPKSYPYNTGMRVADLVDKAMGPMPDAYLKQAQIFRYPSTISISGAVNVDSLQRSVINVDLSQALMDRNSEQNVLLQPRDVFKVYGIGDLPTDMHDVVRVEGAVSKPASYPIKAGVTMRISDLIDTALGLRSDAYLNQALLYRYPAYTKGATDLNLSVITVDLSKALLPKNKNNDDINIVLKSRDLLKVLSRNDLNGGASDTVTVQGAVWLPGSFPLQTVPPMRVADLVLRGFGVTNDAYLPGTQLYRYPTPTIGDDANVLQPRIILINLAQALVPGNVTDNVLLQPRDVLKIPTRANYVSDLPDEVRIEGEVQAPGNKPYYNGMRVAELIGLAGGITVNAYMANVQIYHYVPGEVASMSTVDMTEILKYGIKENVPGNILLSPRDRVVIRSRADITDLVVHVVGEVNNPKTLPYFKKMKVSDAIFLAGGLKTNVALDHALIMRLNEKDMKEDMLDISLRGVMTHDPTQDIELLSNDRLVIYSQDYVGLKSSVTIDGAINSPGVYPYYGGMRVNNLIFLAKDLLQDSYPTRANLYRLLPDNTTTIIPVNLTLAREKPQGAENILMQPSDRLVVPKRSDMEESKIVKIDGFVRHAGSFSLSVGMKLSDVVSLAGGLKPEAEQKLYLNRVGKPVTEILVTTGANGEVVLNVDPFLQKNDLITVRENSGYMNMTQTVSVAGEVTHAGSFPAFNISRENPVTLKQLLTKDGMTGGLLPTAYPAGIVLYRSERAIRSDEQRLELAKILADMDKRMGLTPNGTGVKGGIETVTPQQANDQNVVNLTSSLAKVLTTDQNSKVVMIVSPRSMTDLVTRITIPINADEILLGKSDAQDIALQPDDIIYVPKRPTIVTVVGGVNMSGSVLYKEGEKMQYYIKGTGGVAIDGDDDRIMIMRMNGLVLTAKNAMTILPGDIIIVPTKFMTNTVKTQSEFENASRVVSQTVLSLLGIARLF
ncbi:MAG: SLBB domain-containing protein [bacterium]